MRLKAGSSEVLRSHIRISNETDKVVAHPWDRYSILTKHRSLRIRYVVERSARYEPKFNVDSRVISTILHIVISETEPR